MRKIKFRAWDKEDKKMYIVYRIDFYDVPSDSITLMLSKEIPVGTEMVHEERSLKKTKLMQYTGLKDKNGKEIYEKDLVKQGGWIGEVVWSNGWGGWVTGTGHFDDSGVAEHCRQFEVVGNIYENKELLK